MYVCVYIYRLLIIIVHVSPCTRLPVVVRAFWARGTNTGMECVLQRRSFEDVYTHARALAYRWVSFITVTRQWSHATRHTYSRSSSNIILSRLIPECVWCVYRAAYAINYKTVRARRINIIIIVFTNGETKHVYNTLRIDRFVHACYRRGALNVC